MDPDASKRAADRADRGPEGAKDWEVLSPALQPAAADSLLSARRAERGLTPETAAPEVAAPEARAQVPSSQLSSAQVTSAQLSSAQAAQPAGGQGADQPQQKGQEASGPQAGPSEAAPLLSPESASYSRAAEASPGAEQEAEEKVQALRQEALEDRPRLLWARRALLALAVPLLTLSLSIRAIASHSFLWFEYQRPGFPADSYGFDSQERLRLGSYGLDYILNFAPASYLSEISSQGKLIFQATEVAHMTDVKELMHLSGALALLTLLLALLAATGLRRRAPGVIRSSLFGGAWLSLLLLLALGLIGLTGWEGFFTHFHQIFFPQGNWQFRLSDTLIRLYPPQFWIDAAIGLAGLSLLLTVLLLILTWPTKGRRLEAQRRRAQRQEVKEFLSA